jgi:hypothetical protein
MPLAFAAVKVARQLLSQTANTHGREIQLTSNILQVAVPVGVLSVSGNAFSPGVNPWEGLPFAARDTLVDRRHQQSPTVVDLAGRTI